MRRNLALFVRQRVPHIVKPNASQFCHYSYGRDCNKFRGFHRWKLMRKCSCFQNKIKTFGRGRSVEGGLTVDYETVRFILRAFCPQKAKLNARKDSAAFHFVFVFSLYK